MTTMAKVVLLLLALFKATALETSPSPSPLSNPPFPSPSLAPSPSPLSNPPFPSPSLAPSLSPFSDPTSSSPLLAPSPAPELETPPAPAPAVIPDVQPPPPPPPPPAPIIVLPPPTPVFPPPPAPIVVLPPPTPVFPPPYVPPPSAKELCAMDCAMSCMRKKYNFIKKICMGLCLLKCTLIPSDSIQDINCALDCAQSSTNSLRYDANKMDDRVISCYQQCKRD